MTTIPDINLECSLFLKMFHETESNEDLGWKILNWLEKRHVAEDHALDFLPEPLQSDCRCVLDLCLKLASITDEKNHYEEDLGLKRSKIEGTHARMLQQLQEGALGSTAADQTPNSTKLFEKRKAVLDQWKDEKIESASSQLETMKAEISKVDAEMCTRLTDLIHKQKNQTPPEPQTIDLEIDQADVDMAKEIEELFGGLDLEDKEDETRAILNAPTLILGQSDQDDDVQVVESSGLTRRDTPPELWTDSQLPDSLPPLGSEAGGCDGNRTKLPQDSKGPEQPEMPDAGGCEGSKGPEQPEMPDAGGCEGSKGPEQAEMAEAGGREGNKTELPQQTQGSEAGAAAVEKRGDATMNMDTASQLALKKICDLADGPAKTALLAVLEAAAAKARNLDVSTYM